MKKFLSGIALVGMLCLAGTCVLRAGQSERRKSIQSKVRQLSRTRRQG